MKKYFSVIFLLLLLILLSVVVVWQISSRSYYQEKISNQCSQIESKTFGSERALGLIIREKAILTIRLENEKNFSPPGGHIEPGETPGEALVRELKEELGVDVELNKITHFKTYCEVLGSTLTQRTYIYNVSSWEGIMQPDENSQIKWVTSEFIIDPSADTELIQLIEFAKKQGLIF